ncbi:UTRA domain-containing protein [Streptomyces griseochromogenes]|uniref:UTRA domain-containing protein n=1 Tax=Streptomyces griseochromogenes TaxID=68214 RepID=UPI0037BDE153
MERSRELVADGTVVSYERCFLPPTPVIRELPVRGLGQETLTEVLLRAGLRPDHGEQRIRGRRIHAHEAELLHRAHLRPTCHGILTHAPGRCGYARRSTPGHLTVGVAVRTPLPGDLPWTHPHTTTTLRRRPSARSTRWP